MHLLQVSTTAQRRKKSANRADDCRFSTAIDLASVADLDDLDDDFPVVDGVHNPIVADTQPIRRLAPRKLLAGTGSRVSGEYLNRIDNAWSVWRVVNRLKLRRGRRLDGQSVRHGEARQSLPLSFRSATTDSKLSAGSLARAVSAAKSSASSKPKRAKALR